uniref:branched-chain amino acid ABC transporter permease n=1 Tax=Roseovarius sp. BRH_c41 TaxID=1629709 RepID=UPI0025CCD8C4|nr:branched-chain amino acid ABC transporter permease [Roseovarius sp. BRH_c41]
MAIVSGDVYQLAVFERALIYAVAAASLNMILGFGGMVSFGHAVYLGLGCYATGVLANADVTSAWIQLPTVIAVAGLAALTIGLIVLRTSGVYFIMITLALAQIFYFLAVSSSYFGGDDGMVIYERTTLLEGYDPFDSWQFYGFVAVVALFCILAINHIIRSDFGRRLVACRENTTRATALGFNVFAIRLTGFVLAGVFCGIAGFLLANQTEFATPGYASWQRSGELLVVVILGGVGTRFGPVYGAFAFVLLESVLSSFTSHWPILFGPFLILVVIFFHQGLAGLVNQLFSVRVKTE